MKAAVIAIVALASALLANAQPLHADTVPSPVLHSYTALGYANAHESGFALQNRTTFDVSYALFDARTDKWEADGDLATDGGAIAFSCPAGVYTLEWRSEQDHMTRKATIWIRDGLTTYSYIDWTIE